MGNENAARDDWPDGPPATNEPHEFRALGENWIGEGVPPVAPTGGAAVVGASLEFADRRCVVCRRPETDPIHASAG